MHTNHHSHCLANRHTTPCAIAHGHVHLDVNNAAVTSIVYVNDGHKRGQATDQTRRWVLAAGARSPFVIILDQPAETATRSLRTTARPSVRAVGEARLAVVNAPHFAHPAGFYHVAGVIENVGSRQVEQARVAVALYDKGTRVIHVGLAYPTQARSTSTWPSPTTPKRSATSRLLRWTDYCIRIRVLMVYLARQAHHNR